MTLTKQHFEEILNIIFSVIRNVCIHRAINQNGPMEQNFWRVTSGSAMDVAVVDWCKIFGNDVPTSNPSHWKNVLSSADHAAFRSELYLLAGSEAKWLAYWAGMKNYRDTMAAHLDEVNKRPAKFPHFDLALDSATAYYDRLMALGAPNGWNEGYPIMTKYRAFFAAQSIDIARLAMDASAVIKEPPTYGFTDPSV